MEEQFPPLQNDLILRVARGEQFLSSIFIFIFLVSKPPQNYVRLWTFFLRLYSMLLCLFPLTKTSGNADSRVAGETVERPPIWVMRQGENSHWDRDRV